MDKFILPLVFDRKFQVWALKLLIFNVFEGSKLKKGAHKAFFKSKHFFEKNCSVRHFWSKTTLWCPKNIPAPFRTFLWCLETILRKLKKSCQITFFYFTFSSFYCHFERFWHMVRIEVGLKFKRRFNSEIGTVQTWGIVINYRHPHG